MTPGRNVDNRKEREHIYIIVLPTFLIDYFSRYILQNWKLIDIKFQGAGLAVEISINEMMKFQIVLSADQLLSSLVSINLRILLQQLKIL